MTPRKPDRFDEIVKARMEKDGGIWSDNAADLLRKEHAWMVQMVKSHLKVWDQFPPRGEEADQYGRDCRAAQCKEILSELRKRRK